MNFVTQKQGFVPEVQNDFIFTIIDQDGFIIEIVAILLLFVLVISALKMAKCLNKK